MPTALCALEPKASRTLQGIEDTLPEPLATGGVEGAAIRGGRLFAGQQRRELPGSSPRNLPYPPLPRPLPPPLPLPPTPTLSSFYAEG